MSSVVTLGEEAHAPELEHILTLVATGLAMGVVHVLAGVDHLSALATLSVGSSWRALKLGIRWGLGHSAGLVLVTGVFLCLRGEINIGSIKRYCDGIVGFFMILLGIYSIYCAVRAYNIKRDLCVANDLEMDQTRGKSYDPLTYKKSDLLHVSEGIDISQHGIKNCWGLWSIGDAKSSTTQRLLAFVIGVVHGVAGPGGMLGVIPAIEMKHWYASVLYLTSFVVSSTVCMGAFAAVFGEATKRVGSASRFVELMLNVFSAILSILVGITWITLSVIGKLDELFE